MPQIILCFLFSIGSGGRMADKMQFFIGPTYSSYLLYQDDEEDTKRKWQWGLEAGVVNIIPKIGLKLSTTVLEYDGPTESESYTYKYTPLTFCTSFNLMPFLNLNWLSLSVETGFGLYLWQGLFNDQVMVLPTGEMDEKDLGFAAGIGLQIKPTRYLALSSYIQYNYLMSANIYKYGYFDKDEKIFANGFGIRIFLP